MNRDGKNESLWQQTVPDFPQQGNIDNNAVYDVVVAGAGITGITTGLILQQGGKKVLIAEAANIGFGTSGGTTAHINNIFDSSYDQVIKAFGTDNAKLFADAGRESMQFIKEQVETHRIDCEQVCLLVNTFKIAILAGWASALAYFATLLSLIVNSSDFVAPILIAILR